MDLGCPNHGFSPSLIIAFVARPPPRLQSQFMEAKKIVFKKKRRNNYRRNNGFRHQLTRLRVLKINGIEAGGTTQEVEE